ncbi:uncharacterized protein LOC130590881 [Beta vulgaris subsp. vulgaris]|uniref:uncharacterized protein LOC130590881 n=1 Tax=Beta vulgaris subsp. vulgaris TaxID=3555 RepID=UPI002548C620|nr:uncharacterized protein LOC130590881 [Beta vulgaris subsp. vulgaris]
MIVFFFYVLKLFLFTFVWNFTEQEIKSINLQVLSDYSHLNEVVSNLSDEQKRDIRDIGFGSILDIRIKKFCPNLNLEVLLNYNASGMMFSTKNGKLIFNKFTISDVLGLPVSDRAVEVIDDDAFRRKGSQIEAGSARKDWHRFLGISDPKKVYIGRKIGMICLRNMNPGMISRSYLLSFRCPSFYVL